jgi:hypothetical protein
VVLLVPPRGLRRLHRIYRFATDDPHGFLAKFIRILDDEPGAPAGGLIVDIRGNPGGNVVAGELLLERLSLGAIRPRAAIPQRPGDARLRAREEEQRGAAAAQLRELDRGRAKDGRAVLPRPAWRHVESYDRFGQLYDGPVVLLVDGRSYSTSDLVAAGFQDNGIGPVVGTADRTGAGGAVTVRYDCLRDLLTVARDGQSIAPSAWPALPAEGGLLQFALQRFTRVRAQATEILEEPGGVTVDPELLRRPTRDDLLYGNRDLIAFAVECLRSRAPARGSMLVGPAVSHGVILEPKSRTLRARTERVTNVQVWGPSGWWTTEPVQANSATIPLGGFTGDWVRLDGYNEEGALVVSRRAPVESA